MSKNTVETKRTERIDPLVEMAQQYADSQNDLERGKWANEISKFLLSHPSVRRMIRGVIFRQQKSMIREDDMRQEATTLFVMSVLPRLREPKAAWAAFKGTVNVLNQRLRGQFYDFEIAANLSLDGPKFGDEDESESAESVFLQTHNSVSEESEQEIIDKITSDRAKMAINEALLSSKMNGKNALRWLTRLNKPKESSALSRNKPKKPAHTIEPLRFKDKREATEPNQIVVPVAILARTATARPVPLKKMPYLDTVVTETPAKVPITPEYERLTDIRNRTGMAIQSFASALNIGQPRLRSYLNRKSRVHPEVMARAEQWYKQEGQKREALLEELKATPLPELVENWKEQTNASSYASLAKIMGISLPTISRWRKSGAKPMHDSHLLDAAEKVERYRISSANKRKKQ